MSQGESGVFGALWVARLGRAPLPQDTFYEQYMEQPFWLFSGLSDKKARARIRAIIGSGARVIDPRFVCHPPAVSASAW